MAGPRPHSTAVRAAAAAVKASTVPSIVINSGRNQGTPCLTCFRSNDFGDNHTSASGCIFVIRPVFFGASTGIA